MSTRSFFHQKKPVYSLPIKIVLQLYYKKNQNNKTTPQQVYWLFLLQNWSAWFSFICKPLHTSIIVFKKNSCYLSSTYQQFYNRLRTAEYLIKTPAHAKQLIFFISRMQHVCLLIKIDIHNLNLHTTLIKIYACLLEHNSNAACNYAPVLQNSAHTLTEPKNTE